MNKTFSLPPRKWYTLEQAVKRIAKLTGEDVEIADLLHYWHIGKLNLSVYFVNYPKITQIGDIKFFNKNLLALHIFKDSEEDYSLEDIFSQRQEPRLDQSNSFVKIKIINHKKTNFSDYISGFMSLHCSIDTETNQGLNELINKGILLNCQNYLISPEEITDRRTIILFSLIFGKDIYLPLDNLCVLDYDLMTFLRGETQKLDLDSEFKKMGRKEDPRMQEILRLGRINFKAYPFASANKLAKEIRAFLIKKYNLYENQIITATRISERYIEEGIGAKGKDQDTKKPFEVISD